jgi:hypothetical protein
MITQSLIFYFVPQHYEARPKNYNETFFITINDVMGRANFVLQYENKNPQIHVLKGKLNMKLLISPTAHAPETNTDHVLTNLPKALLLLLLLILLLCASV